MDAAERFARPMYNYAEADRIAGVSPGTSKRWVRGYSYRSNGAHVSAAPVTKGVEQPAEPGVSFFDLIEVAAIGRLKEIGWSLPAIRAAVESCQALLDVKRPLVTERFKSGGRDLFVQCEGELIELGIGRRKGERAWTEVLDPFLKTVAYEGGFVRRWWPIGEHRRVILDPEYGFGLPVVAGSGVRTEIIYEQVQGFVSQKRIADDFNITLEDVEHAIQFEASRTPS